ncbi:LysM peptidoglycan-binding domain-containing protein [Staphylococcus pseudintermedius]|uniref:Peptidase M23 n=1 Tax=Staphylococcus pseudintermedius TaxID=283734 RepID=A0A317YVX0_STAPS|nr:CHAP domain-containing protein [Staphylococcus pseudintermedius]EGQ4058285.1 LysM peptidoglycan-binding domain-containing protein [Staphylococcus pseudintermedius]EGQ4183755.1 LysM peptidoglycan-binding domain-containing protein [Staphylococcus pseudintermedius]EHT8043600.1 LysM peptidoglycan-binding domain-containing protein [Staphylococcus pseudintermedius]EHT8095427.1 LysM peptidoglycan-binding domain-containing protein [Staphylococcus pseudintermedius]EIM5215618.1 LysM peptidoglycan-bin
MKKLAFACTLTSGAAAVAMLNHQDADASTQYTVQSGDSLWSIAQKYGTTVDALKQSNQLQNNMVFPGQVLSIGGGSGAQSSATVPQQTGGTYTVQAGESLNVIATKYGVSVQDLMRANGLTNYLIHPNQQLQIPGGNDGNTAPKTGGAGGTGSISTSGQYNTPTFNHQNLYDWGQCTYHVFDRRAQIGQPISTYWWNADHWAANAAADGYTVDHNPTTGSIMQNFEGPVGHVAFVERVNYDGSILISEMNYNTPPGQQDYRTIPASIASSYNYIH